MLTAVFLYLIYSTEETTFHKSKSLIQVNVKKSDHKEYLLQD